MYPDKFQGYSRSYWTHATCTGQKLGQELEKSEETCGGVWTPETHIIKYPTGDPNPNFPQPKIFTLGIEYKGAVFELNNGQCEPSFDELGTHYQLVGAKVSLPSFPTLTLRQDQ